MPLHSSIVTSLNRLEIPLPDDLGGSAIDILTKGVQWPKASYQTDWEWVRRQAAAAGEPSADWDTVRLSDYTIDNPPSRTVQLTFQFVDPVASFGEWRELFTGADPEVHVPFASDWAYYFFLVDNRDDPSNPRLYQVDHEELWDEPFDLGVTVGQWMEPLIVEAPK